MELYDLIFLGVLGISCFSGVMRGGFKELFDLGSFFIAVFLAIITRPFIANIFHLDTATSYVGAFVMFLVYYIGIRLLTQTVSESLHKQKILNMVDRGFGFLIGVVRSLLIIGVFHLIFSLVLPMQAQPSWFRDAKVYPLGSACAKLLQGLVPKGTSMADNTDKQASDAASAIADEK